MFVFRRLYFAIVLIAGALCVHIWMQTLTIEKTTHSSLDSDWIQKEDVSAAVDSASKEYVAETSVPSHEIEQATKNALIYQRLPKEFRFIPSIEERPLKRRAVMTLLTHGRSNEDDIDFYTMGTIFHAFTHLHREQTKIKSNDTEFVAMITNSIPPHYRKLFLQFGMRLIVVPPIIVDGLPEYTPLVNQFAGKGSRLQFQHTKLQMWRLEDVYDAILYQDSDLFFVKESPVAPLFNYLDQAVTKAPQNATSYIGAAFDCGLDMLNGGMMVFKPSVFHYEKLLKLSNVPPYQDFMEQSLISYYYKKFGTLEYVPDKYNIMPYGRLESFPAKDTIGFHQKFWNDFRSQEGFEWWGSAMLELRKMMLTMGEPASKYVVPGIPKRYDEWCTVRDSNSMFDKTLLLSVGDEKGLGKSDLKSRDDFAAHMFQATHTNFQQQVKKYKLLEALQFAGNQLESTYDWVWLLFPGADFTKNDKPLAAQLGRFKSLTSPLIVFNDCGSLRSGSLLIRKAAAKYLLQYVQDVFDRNVKGNTASALELADDSVWAGLAEVFSYPSVVPGFDVSWRAENNTGYYEYNKQCTYFYPIEAFKV